MSSILEVFKKYYPKLIRSLPMNNECFMAELYRRDLLLDDLKGEIQSLPTSTKKASKFLDEVIKPSVEINDVRKFHMLLSSMKKINDVTINKLANKIRNSLDAIRYQTSSSDETGIY